jgi:hypothetical protein
MYIVEGDLLTAIGDAIREKGNLSRIVQLPLIKKSSNAITGQIPATTPDTQADEFEATFVVNGASSVRVSAYCRLPYETKDGAGDTIDNGGLIIGGQRFCNASSSPEEVQTITKTVVGDSVSIKWYITGYGGYSEDNAHYQKNRFYYLEIDGLDANGNTMETYIKPLSDGADGLTLAQMAEAIGATTRMPLEEDETKILTTNGTHDMNGFRWAEVRVATNGFPTTYKEVVVTSEDNVHFDLSKYIVSDDQYFTLCFTYQIGSKGSGELLYNTGYYHHNPMARDADNVIFNRGTSETQIVSDGVHGGVVSWPTTTGLLSLKASATLENGVLSFTNKSTLLPLDVGTAAVLRYVE